MAVLVERSTDELPFANICILGIDVFVAASIDGGEALRGHERPAAFVVIDPDARKGLMWLVDLDLGQLYAPSVDLVPTSGAKALRVQAHALTRLIGARIGTIVIDDV